MKARNSNPSLPGNSLLRVLILTGAVLLVPFVAMQFSDDVAWSAGDFVAAGILVGGAALVYEFGIRRFANPTYRLAGAVALAGLFLLVWVQMAVGVVGSWGGS